MKSRDDKVRIVNKALRDGKTIYAKAPFGQSQLQIDTVVTISKDYIIATHQGKEQALLINNYKFWAEEKNPAAEIEEAIVEIERLIGKTKAIITKDSFCYSTPEDGQWATAGDMAIGHPLRTLAKIAEEHRKKNPAAGAP